MLVFFECCLGHNKMGISHSNSLNMCYICIWMQFTENRTTVSDWCTSVLITGGWNCICWCWQHNIRQAILASTEKTLFHNCISSKIRSQPVWGLWVWPQPGSMDTNGKIIVWLPWKFHFTPLAALVCYDVLVGALLNMTVLAVDINVHISAIYQNVYPSWYRTIK